MHADLRVQSESIVQAAFREGRAGALEGGVSAVTGRVRVLREFIDLMHFADVDGMVHMDDSDIMTRCRLIDHGITRDHVRFMVRHLVSVLKSVCSPRGQHIPGTPNFGVYAADVDSALLDSGYVPLADLSPDVRQRVLECLRSEADVEGGPAGPPAAARPQLEGSFGDVMPAADDGAAVLRIVGEDVLRALKNPDNAVATINVLAADGRVRQTVVRTWLEQCGFVEQLGRAVGWCFTVKQNRSLFHQTVRPSVLKALRLLEVGDADAPAMAKGTAVRWPDMRWCKVQATEDFYERHPLMPRPQEYATAFRHGRACARLVARRAVQHILTLSVSVDFLARRSKFLTSQGLYDPPSGDPLEVAGDVWEDSGHASSYHGGVKQFALTWRLRIPGISNMREANGNTLLVCDGKDSPEMIADMLLEFHDELQLLVGDVFDVPALAAHGLPTSVKITEIGTIADGALFPHFGVGFKGTSSLPGAFGNLTSLQRDVRPELGGGEDGHGFMAMPTACPPELHEAKLFAAVDAEFAYACGRRGKSVYGPRMAPCDVVLEALHAFATPAKGTELRMLVHLMDDLGVAGRWVSSMRTVEKCFLTVHKVHSPVPQVSMRFGAMNKLLRLLIKPETDWNEISGLMALDNDQQECFKQMFSVMNELTLLNDLGDPEEYWYVRPGLYLWLRKAFVPCFAVDERNGRTRVSPSLIHVTDQMLVHYAKMMVQCLPAAALNAGKCEEYMYYILRHRLEAMMRASNNTTPDDWRGVEGGVLVAAQCALLEALNIQASEGSARYAQKYDAGRGKHPWISGDCKAYFDRLMSMEWLQESFKGDVAAAMPETAEDKWALALELVRAELSGWYEATEQFGKMLRAEGVQESSFSRGDAIAVIAPHDAAGQWAPASAELECELYANATRPSRGAGMDGLLTVAFPRAAKKWSLSMRPSNILAWHFEKKPAADDERVLALRMPQRWAKGRKMVATVKLDDVRLGEVPFKWAHEANGSRDYRSGGVLIVLQKGESLTALALRPPPVAPGEGGVDSDDELEEDGADVNTEIIEVLSDSSDSGDEANPGELPAEPVPLAPTADDGLSEHFGDAEVIPWGRGTLHVVTRAQCVDRRIGAARVKSNSVAHGFGDSIANDLSNVRYVAIDVRDGGDVILADLTCLDTSFATREYKQSEAMTREKIESFIKAALDSEGAAAQAAGGSSLGSALCAGWPIREDPAKTRRWMTAKLVQARLVIEGFAAVASVCPVDPGGVIRILCADKERCQPRQPGQSDEEFAHATAYLNWVTLGDKMPATLDELKPALDELGGVQWLQRASATGKLHNICDSNIKCDRKRESMGAYRAWKQPAAPEDSAQEPEVPQPDEPMEDMSSEQGGERRSGRVRRAPAHFDL